MSRSVPEGFLTIPSPGEGTVSRLRQKLGLLLLHRLLTHPGDGLPRCFARLQQVLPELARAYPTAVKAACANLDFRVYVLAGDYEQAVPTFLLALARRLPRGALEETLLWDRPLARLPDREGGRVLDFDPPARGMVLNGSGAELRDDRGGIVDLLDPVEAEEDVFHPLPGLGPAGPCLATVDSNPLAMLEEHPDKAGNAVDLGGRTPAQWCEALAEALALIEAALPALHQELVGSVERIVPVGFEPERHLSASYLEAPGLVYLTLHPSPLTLAEALVHESQHGKLNLLRCFDPVIRNGHSEWAASPVRPDLRPLLGVFMAVHAFAPVAALHLRLTEIDHPVCQSPEFARRRAQVLGANAAGLATLREHARPTAPGKRVLDALDELHAFTRAAAPEWDDSVGVDALG